MTEINEDKKRVLLIDDEEDHCQLVKMHLEAISDFRIDYALSGKAGLSSAKRLKPNIIVLDVRMPQMGGHEVLERLKKDKTTLSIPVIMLSGVADEESKIKAAQLYDEEYLTKPVEIRDLKAKLEEVLRRRGVL